MAYGKGKELRQDEAAAAFGHDSYETGCTLPYSTF